MDKIRELETALHHPEIRTNREQLMRLLHPEFVEIGYSGRTYDFDTIINSLLDEEPSAYTMWSQNFETTQLADDVFLLIYEQARIDEHGILSRHAKRSSVWTKNNDQWQIIFHQGTPTEPFERAEVG